MTQKSIAIQLSNTPLSTIQVKIKEANSMKFKIIGNGAAGNKAAMELIKNGLIDPKDIVLVNSTSKDFPKDFKGKTIILSGESTGCGKERSIAKEYAMNTLKENLIDSAFEPDDDSVIIITSLEGGTGSGSTPLIGQYCATVLGLNVHIIGFTGFEDDVRGLQNTVEFFQDLDFECDVMTIKNSAFLDACDGNRFKAEEAANKELIERIKVILSYNLKASSQNIDDMDIFKVISTTGYKTIETIYFNKDLMNKEEFNKLCKTMIYTSKSLKSSEPSQNRMAIILNIKPESEDAIDYTFSAFKEEYGNPYESFLHKQYDGGVQYITLISSGMKMPLDEVQAIYDRYKAATSSVNKSPDEFFAQVGAMKKDIADNKFDMVRSGRRASGNKSDFFKQFESKPTIANTKEQK